MWGFWWLGWELGRHRGLQTPESPPRLQELLSFKKFSSRAAYWPPAAVTANLAQQDRSAWRVCTAKKMLLSGSHRTRGNQAFTHPTAVAQLLPPQLLLRCPRKRLLLRRRSVQRGGPSLTWLG